VLLLKTPKCWYSSKESSGKRFKKDTSKAVKKVTLKLRGSRVI